MSKYDTPVKARPSFFAQHEPQHNSHIYRSHQKDVRHMKTDPTLLHHCPERSPSVNSDNSQVVGSITKFEAAVKTRYGSALKPRYM